MSYSRELLRIQNGLDRRCFADGGTMSVAIYGVDLISTGNNNVVIEYPTSRERFGPGRGHRNSGGEHRGRPRPCGVLMQTFHPWRQSARQGIGDSRTCG
ncbi:beta/gamma crystallin domain-containing protein [Nonomuraea sp. NPDC051941]|uniref:beta/gamma crystallin domain-containing protein n=1 Tax=Nonomuraea sp. NPDC051941 TaxID=3364373 RepID=UPI0037CAD33D